MRVAILGASGFIGKNLMLNLQKNWETFAFFNTFTDFPKWAEERSVSENTVFVQQDLSKEFKYPYPDSIPKHFDLVVSLIGDTRKIDKKDLPMRNFNSDPLALVGFFKRFTCDKLLYFSSGAVYEGHSGIVSAQKTRDLHPFSAYAIAKRTSELLLDYFVRDGSVKQYLNVRFFGAHGQYQRNEKITTKLIRAFFIDKQNKIDLFGTGENLIDFMHVQDAVDWILFAIKQKFNNETVDFGTASPITIKELVLRTATVCGVADPVIKFDSKNIPKEDYYFRLGDKWFRPETPFGYEFKINLEQGVLLTKDWLVSDAIF